MDPEIKRWQQSSLNTCTLNSITVHCYQATLRNRIQFWTCNVPPKSVLIWQITLVHGGHRWLMQAMSLTAGCRERGWLANEVELALNPMLALFLRRQLSSPHTQVNTVYDCTPLVTTTAWKLFSCTWYNMTDISTHRLTSIANPLTSRQSLSPNGQTLIQRTTNIHVAVNCRPFLLLMQLLVSSRRQERVG